MSKRLATLQALVEKGSADPFVHYGLAMEYRGEGRLEDALRVFVGLRRDHPDYLAMYLLCGQMLAGESRTAEARDWFEAGLALATTKGDGKAKSELAEALAEL
jgi:predicted Zn-dependent protease